MTQSQINYILDTKELPLNQWLTLEGTFKYLTMNSDKNLYYYPQSVQFYFSENNYLLVRNTTGTPKLYTGGAIPSGSVLIPHDGEQYIVQLEKGGKIDASTDAAGVYHDIISYESISGIFYK
jgi:hypothetical protein